MNSASELLNPLEMVKKTCQAFKLIKSDVRARILGQDEHETDAKNGTLRNSASEVTNPLEMVEKNM